MQDRRASSRAFFLFMALVFGLNVAATADMRRGFVSERPAERAARGGRPPVSLDNAVQNIRDRKRGRVLSADSVRRKGRDVHRIKILTDEGRVRNLYMDPETGKLIRR